VPPQAAPAAAVPADAVPPQAAPADEEPAAEAAPAAESAARDAAARPGAARNGSVQGGPWAVAAAESAAESAAPAAPQRPPAPPAPAAAQPAASGTGWPDPAPAQPDSGPGAGPASGAAAAASADQSAASDEALTGTVTPAGGRRPADRRPAARRGAGSADPWSAATDPIGTAPGEVPGGRQPEDSRPAAGEQPGDGAATRTPAPRWDAGPGGERDTIRSVPARRPAPRRPEPRRPAPGSDLLGDLQRWLIRSGTRSMRHQIEGQVRRTLGGGRRTEPADAWGTATTELPPHLGDSPECAWCPICRAARRMRESGPDLGSQISGASDVVASAVQDAIVAVDAIFSRTASAAGSRRPADGSPDSGPADSAGDAAERGSDEPGDRG
jgi:hypothetical protein